MQFPKRESEVETLATTMLAGLVAHAQEFPVPPVPPAELSPVLDAFRTTKSALAELEGAYQAAMNAKAAALERLIEAVKKDIRYAENVTDRDGQRLLALGWGGRRAVKPLVPPGQPRNLAIEEQGDGAVDLAWRKPGHRSGGPRRAYLVHRRECTSGEWSEWREITSVLEPRASLIHQPRGIALEFRIVAINAAGESMPSNTVAVVL